MKQMLLATMCNWNEKRKFIIGMEESASIHMVLLCRLVLTQDFTVNGSVFT